MKRGQVLKVHYEGWAYFIRGHYGRRQPPMKGALNSGMFIIHDVPLRKAFYVHLKFRKYFREKYASIRRGQYLIFHWKAFTGA